MSAVILARPTREAAVKLLEAASLPTSDLTDAHMEHFYFSGPPDAPIGLIGLELRGADALLRSLVVAPDQRAHGVGKLLVAHVERQAKDGGVKAIYLLTTTAETFFARRGYAAADRASAPEGIRATKEFAGICPASSAFMMKQL